MTQTPLKLLVLGGNRYNVRAIQALCDAGFHVLVADRNPQAAGLAVADVPLPIDLFAYDELVTAVAANGGVAGVISMAEVGVRPAAVLSERLGLPSMTQTVAYNATSKAAMRRHWADSPYSVPFRVVNSLAAAEQAARDLNVLPLIVKPDRSFGGSRGVSRVESLAEIRAAYDFAVAAGLPHTDVVVEQCVSGQEFGAEVLVYQGEASVLTIAQKIKSPQPYRVDMTINYGTVLAPGRWQRAAEMLSFAVRALGIENGVGHVEFAYTEDGPILFELGARCGGGHIPLIAHHVSGVHEVVEFARIACGIAPINFHPTLQRGGDYRFLNFPPGIIRSIMIPDEVRQHPQIMDVDVTLVPGQTIEPLRTTAQRAGFLVALGDDYEAAVAVANWACEQIIVAYEDGRQEHAMTFNATQVHNG